MVKEGIANHFEQQFKKNSWLRPTMDGINFKHISDEENKMLMEVFTREEVKNAVWACEGNEPGSGWVQFFHYKKIMEYDGR